METPGCLWASPVCWEVTEQSSQLFLMNWAKADCVILLHISLESSEIIWHLSLAITGTLLCFPFPHFSLVCIAGSHMSTC